VDARSNSRFNPVTGLTNIVSRIVRTRCSNSIVVANTFSSRRSSHKTINGTICSENTKVGLHFVYKTSNATTCWNSINDDRSRKIFTNKAGGFVFGNYDVLENAFITLVLDSSRIPYWA